MIYVFDKFELDAKRRELRHDGELVEAEAMSVRLLARLVDTPGRLVTKDELIDQVWDGRALADNAITVCAARLRKVLRRHGGDSGFVTTVYGQGYRFVKPVTRMARTASSQTPLPAAPREHESAPCVGRERVIERLLRRYEDAIGRQGAVCAIMGAAGVGKTRVVEAFEHRLGARQTVVWAYCRDSGTAPPLSPWLRVLRTLSLDAWSPSLAEALGPHAPEVRSWLGLDNPDGVQRSLAPGLRDSGPPTGTEVRPRRASFEAILRTLSLVSSETPLCVVLDDLHRADAASLELLDMLLAEIGRMRILLLCTLRPAHGGRESRPETQLPAILGHRNCERIPLSRLAREDVETYLQARLGGVEPAVVEAVFAGSEGIPFFMVELSRQLEGGAVDPASLSVPAAALELFRGRVEGLGSTAQRVLRAAAAIGRAFELPLLQDTCELRPAEVLAGIDEAIAFEMIVAAPGTASAFAFEHELMRRAIYEAIPTADRRRLHLKVAAAMERRGVVSDQLTHDLAHHLHQALPEGDPDRVIHYCEEAARAAGAAFANADASAHVRRALEAHALKPDPDPYQVAILHLRHAMYVRGRAACHESLEVVRRIGYELGHGPLLEGVGFMYNPHPLLSPLADGQEVLRHALSLLPQDDYNTRAGALGILACTAPGCFDRETTEARLSASSEQLAEVSNPTMRYHALLAELHMHGGPAHGKRRVDLRAELCQLVRANPDRMRVLPIDLALDRALHAMQRGQLNEAEAALAQAERRARAINHRELTWHAKRLSGWLRIERSPSSQSLFELTALHRTAARTGIVGVELFSAFDRSVLSVDGNAPVLDDTDLFSLLHAPHDPVHVWAMKIRALLAAGQTAEGRESLHSIAAERIAALPCDGQALGSLAQLGRAAISLAEPGYAEAVANWLTPYPDAFAINLGFCAEGCVAEVLGELHAFLGDDRRARDLLAHGAELSERAGFARSAARARDALIRLASS